MTEVVGNGRACTANPLKLSPALGGSLAFLGIDRCLPLLHGSQGCTAFALVLMVRHFREAIPLQTTAMSELSTILGGADNVETAIGNIYERARPRVIGICSTALTDTRGEDIVGELRETLAGHKEWADLDVVLAPTPDYAGGLQEGWAAAVKAVIDDLVPEGKARRTLRQVNLLARRAPHPGGRGGVARDHGELRPWRRRAPRSCWLARWPRARRARRDQPRRHDRRRDPVDGPVPADALPSASRCARPLPPWSAGPAYRLASFPASPAWRPPTPSSRR